jgi:hypothetical protein
MSPSLPLAEGGNQGALPPNPHVSDGVIWLVAHRPRLVATSKRRWRSSTSALRIRKNLNQVAHCSFRFRVWSAGGQCAFLDNTPNGCKMHASATARSCSTPVHASARRYRSSVPDLPRGVILRVLALPLVQEMDQIDPTRGHGFTGDAVSFARRPRMKTA